MIGTGSIIGLDDRVHAKIAGENCYGPAKMRMIADWVEASGLKGKHGHVRFYSDHVSDRPAFDGPTSRCSEPSRQAAPAGGAARLGDRGLGLDRVQCVGEIGDEVIRILDPDRDAHQVRRDAELRLALFGNGQWVIAAGALASVPSRRG